MKNRLHFRPIGSRDATDLAKLQAKSFPPHLREDREEIEAILRDTETHFVCNLSLGLFDGRKMVGYLFAYIEDNSLYFGRAEEVLYIKEIVLLPGYQATLRRMFQKLFYLWSAFCPGLPLEAHAEEQSLRMWQRMIRGFRHYGLTLSSREDDGEDGQAAYLVLRLDVDDAISGMAEEALPLPHNASIRFGNVDVDIITEPRQWLSLREDWQRLLSRTTDSNVFQSFDYLWSWWKYFGTWNDLRIIVLSRGGTIIGIAPLMIEHFTILGQSVRKLMFISSPMEMHRPKMIFADDESECTETLFALLGSIDDEWDILDIDEQIDGNSGRAIFAALGQRDYLVAESETICPYIDLHDDWSDFLATRSKKFRSNINRLRRKLNKSSEVKVQISNTTPALLSDFDRYCEIESRSRKVEQSLDIAGTRESYYFYRSLAETFGRDERFELRILCRDSTDIAGTFGIRDGDTFQSIKIAHDSRFDNFSPGTLLESYELESLFESSLSRYEFMGSFLSNKLRWTSEYLTTRNIHIYQRQPRLAVFFFVHFVFKRFVKKSLKRLGLFDKTLRLLDRLPGNLFPRYS